ncbi:polyketide synthase [Kalaharituber pfeilii]|nr:polyketide synthase [Kalaharituber pfeilii]
MAPFLENDFGTAPANNAAPTVATSRDDPVAIVGIACRTAGASSPSKLWDLISAKRDVQRKMPGDRFNVDAFFHPKGANKGTTNAKYGYFLDQDIAEFDAGFFNISGREAEAMDPQQRLLLEVVYEALEDAGLSLEEIDGSLTSVYCGCFTNDYDSMTTKDLAHYPMYTVTGTGNAILANRISYFYNLQGTSCTIDTACSSSLVCLHLGATSLLTGEADLSIVVGSALHFDPNIFITMTDLGMLSVDGRCRTFDASGKGYVRGEGICAAVLKRQRAAEDADMHIRAIVRGSGSNHDGRKQGITLPNPVAQEALIRRVYKEAGADFKDTQYFEAHGTGTAAGDPREASAIGNVFAPGRKAPLWVGSVKSNIGHLEGASGLAGVIKATLALEHLKIPPNMHFVQGNPNIDFKGLKIQVPTEMVDWPETSGPKRASINSFGYGGTNGHVLLERYEPKNKLANGTGVKEIATSQNIASRPYLLPLTSHSEKAGKLQAAKFIDYIKAKPDVSLLDLSHSLSTKRAMHKYRSFAIGQTSEEVVTDLAEPQPISAWTPKLGDEKLRVGFALPDAPAWSVIEELMRSKEDTKLMQTAYSQPICTALQLALVEQLKSWGITPNATVGHSSGEMAAAYAAGILSFEDTIVTAYYRGLYMSNTSVANADNTKKGSMMAVGLTESECKVELKEYQGRICIGAINSPSSITLSGDEDAILELKEKLTARKVFARQLIVAQAFHSHHMFPLAPGYQRALEAYGGLTPQKPSARMFSSVTARVADPERMGPEYWVANMVSSVRFSDALTGILLDDLDEKNVDILVEVGPHPALKGPARQVMQSVKLEVPYIASLTRGLPDYKGLLACAGQLFQLGYPVDLTAVNALEAITASGKLHHEKGTRIRDLPSYAWDHAKYWAETRVIKNHRLRTQRHTLLGAQMPNSVDSHPRWRNYLRKKEVPWLNDHQIEGKVIFPAAGYIAMAIQAICQIQKEDAIIKNILLKDIAVKSALALNDTDAGNEVILELRPAPISAKSTDDAWREFVLFSYDENERCQEHCRGLISVELGSSPAAVEPTLNLYTNFADVREQTRRTIPSAKYYNHLRTFGLGYDANFQCLKGNVESGAGFSIAPLEFEVAKFAEEPHDVTYLHPTLLDSSFHLLFPAIESSLGRPLSEPFVPTFMRSMKVSGEFVYQDQTAPLVKYQGYSRAHLRGPRVAYADLRIHDAAAEKLLVEIIGLECTALGGGSSEEASGRSLFFRTRWQPMFDFLAGCDLLRQESVGISTLVDIYAHQYPNTKILHITEDAEKAREVLKYLGGNNGDRRRFASLNVVSGKLSTFDTLGGIEKEWNGLVSSKDVKEGEYDLLVVSEGTVVDGDVARFVKQGGVVLSDRVTVDTIGLTPMFGTTAVRAWRKTVEKPEAAKSLAILMPKKPSKRTLEVAAKLEKEFASTSRFTIEEAAGKLNSVPLTLAVLVNLDEDLFVEDMGPSEYEAVKKVFTRTKQNAVWVLEGAQLDAPKPQQAVIVGLARSIRSENEESRLVTLDLTPTASASHVASRIITFLDPTIAEDEISDRNGTISIPRVEADDSLNCKLRNGVRREARLEPFIQERNLALKIGKAGLLETLAFGDDEDALDHPLQDDEIEIEVKASAINFRDVAASMGIINEYNLGDECAGIVVKKGKDVKDEDFKIGDRVVAWRPGQGAHRRIVRNPASLCYRLRGELPFEIATALPLILTTAYYALVDVARLQPGETILIHSALGGVGQMALQIAQNIGATVLATVGSQAKRDILKTKFGLKDEQIFSSRDASFVKGCLEYTGGKGVDVVLNSLAGKLLHATWSCVNAFGRFIEIGKRDIHENTKIDMDPFRRNVTFASVDLVTMFERNKPLGAKVFKECCEMVHEGKIQPPEPITTFTYAEAQKAFRLMQMGKHTGKLVLMPKEDDIVPVLPQTYREGKLFKADKTYLLVGGLGGLGRTLAEWMVRKGAKSLAFLSRSGDARPEAKSLVEWLRDRKVNVEVYKGDINQFNAVKSAVDAIGQKLGGVFQAAMILQDAPFEQMTYKQWFTGFDPKVKGTWNLHKATLSHKLDFFICFSSISTIIGGKAQANYSAGNAYLDALMRHRRELGLKGTTMNCGMIVGVGAVSEDAALEAIMKRIGYDAVNEEEVLYQCEEAVLAEMNSPTTNARGVDTYQIITGINLSRDDLYWAPTPKFRNIYANHDFSGSGNSEGAAQNLSVVLRSAANLEECTTLLCQAFVEKIAAVLAVGAETIIPTNSLAAYGLDSLVAVELRNWFLKTVGVDIALFDVLGAKTINSLVAKAAAMIPLGAVEEKAAGKAEGVADKTSEAKEEEKETIALVAGARGDTVPMSFYQRRLWFIHNFIEDKAFLNLPVVVNLKGKPDVEVLKETLNEMVRRNEMLRTRFYEGDEDAEQEILDADEIDLELPFHDLTFSAKPEVALQHLTTRLGKTTVLEIEEGEVFNIHLAQLGEEEYALICILHHIAIDRGSSKPFLDQMVPLYDAIKAGNPESVPEPALQYADFTIWHNALLASPQLHPDIEYWRQRLAGAPEVGPLLPFAKAERPAYNDYKRSILIDWLDIPVLNRLKRVCTRAGLTPFQFLLAAFRTFHYRYTDEKDLTILMIDGNRPHPDVENMLGFFVNMMPVRVVLENDEVTFDQLLEQVRELAVEAIQHNAVPFDAIINALGVKKDPSHFPLAQVVINYQIHGKIPKYTTKDFEMYDVRGDDIPTACEMNLEALEDPEKGLSLRLEYSSTLYGKEEMERFLENFLVFLTSAVKDHRQPLSEIAMCGEKEMSRLQKAYHNNTFTKNFWDGQSVIDKIMEQAELTPNATAIVTSSGETATYAELANKASRLGHKLREMGVKQGNQVGLLSRPGVEAIASMIGILANGAGYVPLDPDFAVDRLAFMIEDSGTEIVVVGSGLKDLAVKVVGDSKKTLAVAEGINAAGKLTPVNVTGNEPFYTIYTSGSTGKPKGVVLTQNNTQSMLSTLHRDYKFSSSDAFLHQSSICFDLSIVQIFNALTAGATVCVAEAEIRKDPSALVAFMKDSGVSFTYFTPTQFALLVDQAADSLKHLHKYRVAFFAGERLPVRVAKAFYDLKTPATAYNTWSPSEVVVQTTIHRVEYPNDDTTSIPIGYPLANCRHYILDSKRQVLPLGQIGEICVGGAQVGVGYLNRPAANAKSFIESEYATEDDKARGWTRIFRTGDRGRFRPDGQLEFHGRIAGDKQIKLRGYRIDLGEVEHRIYTNTCDEKNQPELIDLSVVARETAVDTSGIGDSRQLVAYLVHKEKLTQQKKQAFVTRLHEELGKILSSYMLPNGYQFLNALPVTIGGKVDRQNLLTRELDLIFPGAETKSEKQEANTSAVDPEILSKIKDLFKAVLKLPASRELDATDNFFQLGGQSVLLVRLQARIKKAFKVAPLLSDLFKEPTPLGATEAVVKMMQPASGSLKAKSASNGVNDIVDWQTEGMLPTERKYTVQYGAARIKGDDIETVFMTGIDSFIGTHMLAEVLSSVNPPTVYLLGTRQPITHAAVVKSFEDFKLFTRTLTRDVLTTRTVCVDGTLEQPHFGLSDRAFRKLGQQVQAIYSIGAQISLLKSYADLKRLNVEALLDIIELAGHGRTLTRLNQLSTWSVPHLQTLGSPSLTRPSIVIDETPVVHFTPEPTNEHGYFKSRWVAENLLTQAAERGFDVRIYRASAATGSTLTGIPEPADDFVRTMVIEGFVRSGYIPQLNPEHPDFVVDLVPVNYLTNSLYRLSFDDLPPANSPAIYHLTNPSPLSIYTLATVMRDITGKEGTIVSLDEWLEKVMASGKDEQEMLGWSVLNGYLKKGHIMFALDQSLTEDWLERVGKDVECPPIDAAYLKGMMEAEKRAVVRGGGVAAE